MSIILKAGRAAKLLKALKPGIKTGVVAGMTVGGSAIAYDSAQPGLRHQAYKEGAISGLIGGLALISAPWLGKQAAKGASRAASRAARKASTVIKRKGSLTFRRVRGRIIPIRVK